MKHDLEVEKATDLTFYEQLENGLALVGKSEQEVFIAFGNYMLTGVGNYEAMKQRAEKLDMELLTGIATMVYHAATTKES